MELDVGNNLTTIGSGASKYVTEADATEMLNLTFDILGTVMTVIGLAHKVYKNRLENNVE
jgi:hypothetical protein